MHSVASQPRRLGYEMIDCARATSADVLLIGAVPKTSAAYDPETLLSRFEHDAAPSARWYFGDVDSHLEATTRF